MRTVKVPNNYKIRGETFPEWAERLFEFEYCAECGKDAPDHDAAIVLGNWFAMCREKNVTAYEKTGEAEK